MYCVACQLFYDEILASSECPHLQRLTQEGAVPPPAVVSYCGTGLSWEIIQSRTMPEMMSDWFESVPSLPSLRASLRTIVAAERAKDPRDRSAGVLLEALESLLAPLAAEGGGG